MIVIEASEDDDEERTIENGTHYTEAYLHGNEGDIDEVVAARLRARLRKKPRFLHRYEKKKRQEKAASKYFSIE